MPSPSSVEDAIGITVMCILMCCLTSSLVLMTTTDNSSSKEPSKTDKALGPGKTSTNLAMMLAGN